MDRRAVRRAEGRKTVKGLRILGASAALLLVLTGCRTIPSDMLPKEPSSSQTPAASAAPSDEPKAQAFAVSFSSEDTLNPYAAKTRVNLDLATLLYSSLTVLDDAFMPQPSAAATVQAADPLHWTAVLREDALFSDGSRITPDDVAASFQLAKSSANYKDSVSNIETAEAGENAVTFTLASPDPNTAACLTFPIVKKDTVTAEAGKAPLGGGLYVFKAEGTAYSLEANPKSGQALSIPKIQLQHLPGSDAMLHGLENGTISFFFSDLADGEILRPTNASTQVPLSYLVFLGVNASRDGLKDASVRTALSYAVNRTALAETAFSGWAEPASTPFHPLWKPVVEITGFSTGENTAEAVAQLEAAGYNTKSDPQNPGKNAKTLELELLYTSGNSFRQAAAELLVQQFAAAGVTVKATALSYDDYTSRLRKGSFDLYLGEVRMTGDMNLRPFLTAGGTAAYGVKTDGAAAAAYSEYLSGGKTLAEFVEAFVEDTPYIPLCWRKGIAAYARSMSRVTPSAFDLYHGIANWSIGG